ncbi:lipopolysaccharide biosynthesis protein [Pleomorphomonas oryzae]|uniref:lipopolysaccharide biosynthesis protein n=1 Tax=Pleomorphomonas oryzae TaxID=261934 RepID=UPI00041A1C23|nr:lipopolysaccharide biosynthesis protein [Pleomorphomonas oryzae]
MLIRQTILYLPAQFLSPVAQFLSMMIWTWWLSPTEMSTFVLVTSTQELAYMVSRSWFSFYTLRFLPPAEDVSGRRRYLETETTLIGLLTLPELAAAALSMHFFDGRGDQLTVFLIIAAYYVTRGLNNHFGERARAQDKIFAYTLLLTSGPVGGLVAGLFTTNIFGASAGELLLAYAAMQVVGTAVALPMIGASFRIARLDLAILKHAILNGGPMLAVNGIGWFGENGIRYVVDQIGGSAAFGLMAVGWGLGRRSASVASMLVAVAAFPIAARMINAGDREAALEQLKTNAALLTAVLLPSVVGLWLVTDILVDLAVSETYRDVTRAILGLAAFGGMVRAYHAHATGQMLILDGRYGLLLSIGLFEITATCGLAAFGFHTNYLVGVVGGALLASSLTLALSAIAAIRLCGFRFPVADTVRIAAASLVMGLVVHAVNWPHTALGLVGAVAIGGLSYVATLAALYYRHLPPLVGLITGKFAGTRP